MCVCVYVCVCVSVCVFLCVCVCVHPFRQSQAAAPCFSGALSPVESRTIPACPCLGFRFNLSHKGLVKGVRGVVKEQNP